MLTKNIVKISLVGLVMVFPCLVLGFKQNLYRYVQERGEVARFNTSYLSEAKMHNFKYNRTQAVFNFTLHFVKDFDMKPSVTIQAYRFASNEYRYYPIRLAFDFCTVIKTNDFGLGGFMTNGNFTCPLKKERYHVGNFAFDGRRFPPFVPEGSYKVEVQLFDDITEFIFLEGYGKIVYPIV